MKTLFLSLFFLSGLFLFAQDEKPFVSKVWVADLGNGGYQNPILHADYSDPDKTTGKSSVLNYPFAVAEEWHHNSCSSSD